MSAAALRQATDEAQQAWSDAAGRVAARWARDLAAVDDPVAAMAALHRALTREVAVAAGHGVDHARAILRAGGVDPTQSPTITTRPPVALERTIREEWERAARAADGARARQAAVQRIVDAALTDAWRDGQHAVYRAEPAVVGLRRVSRPGCCGACLALSTGRVLALDAAIEVHPFCRCIYEPVLRGVNLRRSGRQTGLQRWAAMTAEEQDDMFHGHGGRAKADLIRSRSVRLADLVKRAPRVGRALAYEAPLSELRTAATRAA